MEDGEVRTIESALVVSFLMLAAWICFSAPPKHNPDGNYYFGVTLRLLNGDLTGSIEGLYSPLLSWLMVLPASLGLPIPFAFRVVNYFVFAGVLACVVCIARRVALKGPSRVLALFLTGLHLEYFTVGLVTSDLLAAAIYLPAVCLLLHVDAPRSPKRMVAVGLLAALSYYAKAMQLPIFLCALFLLAIFWRMKRIATTREVLLACGVAGGTCLAASLPWIITLSLQYRAPIISAQQLLIDGRLSRLYSPSGNLNEFLTTSTRVPHDPASADNTAHREQSSLSTLLSHRVDQALFSLSYFSRTTGGLFFGPASWWFYLAFLAVGICSPKTWKGSHYGYGVCAIFVIAQFIGYLSIWGPYLRYYFPIYPLMHILFAKGCECGWEAFKGRAKNFRLLTPHRLGGICGLLFALILLGTTRTTVETVVRDWRGTSWEVVRDAVNIPELKNGRGVMTGNDESPYPGVIAYMLGREFWEGLPKGLSREEIKERIKKWNVEQVIWCDKERTSGRTQCVIDVGFE